MPRPPHRLGLVLSLLLIAAVCGGCSGANPRDPLEPINRSIFKFNDGWDKVVSQPVAEGYKAVLPPPVRNGVSNFFGNWRDTTTAINNFLQFKLGRAASDVGRIIVNTTVGFFGVFDVASRIGLQKHEQDFGLTLGVWGIPNGPYLVLPFLGPSTARDTVGYVVDIYTDPQIYLVTNSPETYIVLGVRIVNVRANLLEAGQIFEQAAVDRYAFLRDAYLQRRRSQMYDGNPPIDIPDQGGGAPQRKTLKQMEHELDLDEPPPPEQPKPEAPQQ
jgi:phospholipid-binding lipoprotein MlaA